MRANWFCSYVFSYSFINSYYRLSANWPFWTKSELLCIFLIIMAWTGLMSGKSFFNTQLFRKFFSTTDWRFSKFFCGFRSKAENSMVLHFFQYFVKFTPGFKAKLYSIMVNTEINVSKSDFLFRSCLPISAWIKIKKNSRFWRAQKETKLNKEKIFW